MTMLKEMMKSGTRVKSQAQRGRRRRGRGRQGKPALRSLRRRR